MNIEHLKIEFFCGTTVDRNGQALPPRFVESAHVAAQRDLLNTFDGYTKTQVAGAWRDPGAAQPTFDVSTVYTLVVPNADTKNGWNVENAARELKERFQAYFNQESVLLVITPVLAQF